MRFPSRATVKRWEREHDAAMRQIALSLVNDAMRDLEAATRYAALGRHSALAESIRKMRERALRG